MFNVIVEPHKLAPYLLRAINWAQPDDPEKKYPLLGRLRYVWMSQDYTRVKLLLKDGSQSWSEEKEEIMNQITSHETFVSVEELERDPVYLVATFEIVKDAAYDRGKSITEQITDPEFMKSLDGDFVQAGLESVVTDPFDIFDKGMANLGSNEKAARMMKEVMSQVEASLAKDSLLKQQGIKTTGPEIVALSVDLDGKVEDVTEDFLGGEKDLPGEDHSQEPG